MKPEYLIFPYLFFSSISGYLFGISGLDPWTGLVNKPETVETDATAPVHYVLCIDNGKFYGFF